MPVGKESIKRAAQAKTAVRTEVVKKAIIPATTTDEKEGDKEIVSHIYTALPVYLL